MKKDLTELVFILDRSGSMSGLESDTVGGFNNMLAKQKAVEGEAVVTTVLFDNFYELLHDRINIQGIAPITSNEYFVRGSTALLDAIGKTILKIKSVQEHTAENLRAEKVLFVITTDGLENSSREFSNKRVKELVEEQRAKGWEFIFLGANIDSFAAAEDLGISRDYASNYHADSKGTFCNYVSVNEAIYQARVKKSIDKGWKAKVERDYNERSKA